MTVAATVGAGGGGDGGAAAWLLGETAATTVARTIDAGLKAAAAAAAASVRFGACVTMTLGRCTVVRWWANCEPGSGSRYGGGGGLPDMSSGTSATGDALPTAEGCWYSAAAVRRRRSRRHFAVGRSLLV